MMPDKESRKLLNIERFCLTLVNYEIILQQILETLHSFSKIKHQLQFANQQSACSRNT